MVLKKDDYIFPLKHKKCFIIFTEKKSINLFREEFTWHTLVLKILDKSTKMVGNV